MSTELSAVLELLGLLFLDRRTGVLIALLVTAACIDAKSGRIPNWLVFSGAGYALLYNALFPAFANDVGILVALEGLGLGLGLLLPFYILHAMGAGDVKLMAMIGAFLGPWDTFLAVLATFIAGGVLALGYALRAGVTGRMFQNILMIFRGAAFDLALASRPVMTVDTGASVGKLPYGVAIAVGTIGYLVLKQLGIV